MFDAEGSRTDSYRLSITARTTEVTGGTLVEIFAEVTKTRIHGTVATSGTGSRSWNLPGGRSGSTSGTPDSSGGSSWSYNFPASSTNTENVYNFFNRYIPYSYGSSTTLSVTASGVGSLFLTSRTVSVNVPLFQPPAIPAPSFTSTPSSSILNINQYYDFFASASNTTSYSITNVGVFVPIGSFGGIPSGMSITTYNSGQYAFISGTPNTVGDYYFRVRAQGPGGTTDSGTIVFYVRYPAPSFSDSSVTTNWVVNKNYSLAADRTVAASNATSYSIVNPGTGTFASWLSVNSSGQLSGTPTATGTYSFRVRATGPGGDTVDTATISIVVHGVVSWIDETLANGIKGVPYSDSVNAANATSYSINPAFNFSTSGLSFNPLSGLIAGTPKEITSYTFTITASNPGDSISKQFTISFKSGGKRIENETAITIGTKKRYDSATSNWVDISTAKRWSASANQWIDISN
jgi:large repetitive protein